ncbi:MAG: cytochrome c oxidase subunit II [Planctomycetales bacterium]|nr:cytochrome c oxidase subunit II [Planctomycetales bacterium]
MSTIAFPYLLADKPETFFFPPKASTFAAENDFFYMALFYIALFFFLLIVVGMIVFVIKYRQRPGYEGDPRPLHNNALEITWTVIPTLIVCWIFARGVYGYMEMMRAPAETIDINVEARKWNWLFEYPNGARDPVLHIPNDKAIRLRMRSVDVLHCLYVPAFRCKTDVVPGRVTQLWFQPIREGTFDIFCAEYCGDQHSEMLTKVVVHSQEDYEAWLAEAVKPPIAPVAHGQWLYERMGCKSCHSLEPNKVVVGPSFNGSYGKSFRDSKGQDVSFDANYVRESVLAPQAVMRPEFVKASQMPSFQGKLKENEITAITAFLQALEDGNISDEEMNAVPAAESTENTTGEGETDSAAQAAEQVSGN